MKPNRKVFLDGLVGVIVVLGHVALAVYVLFLTTRLPSSDRWDLLLIMVPASLPFATMVVQYVLMNPGPSQDQSEAGFLYAALIPILVIAGVAASFFCIYSYETEQINDLAVLKRMVSGAEIWFGGILALIVSSIFADTRNARSQMLTGRQTET